MMSAVDFCSRNSRDIYSFKRILYLIQWITQKKMHTLILDWSKNGSFLPQFVMDAFKSTINDKSFDVQ